MMHIGKRIKEVFDAHPKQHNVEWLAERLHCRRANIYKIFNRNTVDLTLLYNLSKILDHDFFIDISHELKINSGKSDNCDVSK